MIRSSRVLLPVVLIAPLLLAACGTETSDLPPGLGPIALADVALPADCANATGVGALNIGPARGVLGNPSYTERKARGCVPFSVAKVWQAIQVPTGVDVAFWPERNESDCEAWLLVDPAYPVNFITKEIPHGGIQSHYTFEITWRAGITKGPDSAPTEVKMLYGKTSGTSEVPKILGSMVFTADAAHPNWTTVDIVRQLNTNGHSDDPAKLESWIQGFYDGLQIQLATGALLPRYCVLP
ncbi:MAG: hypothetical protein WCK73_02425 [Deltaproteobacteria bacterium]